jgi:hypothetical protein
MIGHSLPSALECENNGGGVSEWAFNKPYFADKMSFGVSLWQYYEEFYKCRNLDSVLIVAYEDIVKDLASQLPRIAKFIGVPEPTEEQTKLIVEMTSKSSMSSDEHYHKFDDSKPSKLLKQVNTMPANDQKRFIPFPRVSTKKHKDELNDKVSVFCSA